MGMTAHSVGVTFFTHDDTDAFPDDRKCLEDFQGLLGAVLADPSYEDQVPDAGGYVDMYNALMADPVARGRVAFILIQALARVRRGPDTPVSRPPADWGAECLDRRCQRGHDSQGRHTS